MGREGQLHVIDLAAAQDVLRKAEADGLTDATIVPVTLRWFRQTLAELAQAQFFADRALDLDAKAQ